jgi:DNA-binding transcriptional LysR family regulator
MVTPMLGALGLALLPVPMLLPAFTISMIWHKRHATDGAHAWFRGAVQRAAARTKGRSTPSKARRRPLSPA